jgi:1-acyl-sn-glycerol-3-phosphate acyltransferase
METNSTTHNKKVASSSNEYAPEWLMILLRFSLFWISKAAWQIKFFGIENIPQNLEGGLIISSNHQTYIDPFWIVIPVKRKLRYMAWDKAYQRPIIGTIMKFLGAFPVGLDGKGSEAYKKSIKILREGATLVIFPEGTREFSDGKLIEFKTGAVRIALEAKVPILPVTLRGANRVWSQEMKYPKFFRKIEVIYHPLMEIPECPKDLETRDFANTLTDKLEEIIRSKMSK